jgi:hypothetical protein
MDNGLIFPYPRRSAPDQARCANRAFPSAVFGPGVGAAGTPAGSSQAMG